MSCKNKWIFNDFEWFWRVLNGLHWQLLWFWWNRSCFLEEMVILIEFWSYVWVKRLVFFKEMLHFNRILDGFWTVFLEIVYCLLGDFFRKAFYCVFVSLFDRRFTVFFWLRRRFTVFICRNGFYSFGFSVGFVLKSNFQKGGVMGGTRSDNYTGKASSLVRARWVENHVLSTLGIFWSILDDSILV